MVWNWELELHHLEDGCYEAFCLSQGQMKYKPQREDGLNSLVWCCLPLLLDALGFHVLMTEGDTHRVKETLFLSELSYSFQLVTLYFFLYFGLRLRLCNSFMSASFVETESNE